MASSSRRVVPPTLHGDETGLVKQVEYDTEGTGKAVGTFGVQSREHAVDKLCVLGERQVAIGLRNGEVRAWNGTDIQPLAKAVDGQRIRGLCGFQDRLVSCGQNGKIEIRVWPTGELSGDFKVDSAIDCGVLNSHQDGTRLAVGGKNHDLRIWDVETKQALFRAKNVPHDSLNMQVPIWITDACWTSDGMVMTSTAYNQIRAYDLRQRKPVRDVSIQRKNDEHNHHLNCIVATPESNNAIVGDNFGIVSIVDVMNTGKVISSFKGPKGSVRSLSLDPATRTLACGGLDRYVRVFNIDSHRQVGRFYAKQQVNAVALGAVSFVPPKSEEEDDESELDWGEPSDEDDEEEDDGRLLHDSEDDDDDDADESPQPVAKKKSVSQTIKKARRS